MFLFSVAPFQAIFYNVAVLLPSTVTHFKYDPSAYQHVGLGLQSLLIVKKIKDLFHYFFWYGYMFGTL